MTIFSFNSQIGLLALGRCLSQAGSGLTMFYAAIFFVNQVKLSPTAVGWGMGLGSVTGILGRILSGSLADVAWWGRKPTVVLSAIVSAIACFLLAAAQDFPLFLIGNLLLGFGVGLYWPATEAIVADLSPGQQRQESFALTRLADNLGLGLGVALGGWWVERTQNYQLLFILDGLSFLVFWLMVWVWITEPTRKSGHASHFWQGWQVALKDRALLIYIGVNILFTVYIAQTQITLPLYFTNFINGLPNSRGFSAGVLSALLVWHMLLMIVLQLPAVRLMRNRNQLQGLTLSAIFWAIGFLAIWLTGFVSHHSLAWAIVTMAVLAMAIVTYTPTASAFVVFLAPEHLRGVYLSINSLCWAIGYFIGPPLGGWALDQIAPLPGYFWLAMAGSLIGVLATIDFLTCFVADSHTSPPPENSSL